MIIYLLFFFPIFAYSLKVAFNGASITRQTPGYVEETHKYFPHWSVVKYGYGGAPLSLCLIEKVIQEKPDLAFLDWSMHNVGGDEVNIIKTLVFKFRMNNILPVFIHMPRTDGYDAPIINSIDFLSNQLNFSVIDLRKEFSQEDLKTKYLRDICHTNNIGSAKYGEKIFQFLKNNELKIPKEFGIEAYYSQDIKFLSIDKTIYKSLDFNINGSLIGILGVIGPYSNHLQLNINNSPKYIL